jgi:hypothetical protein
MFILKMFDLFKKNKKSSITLPSQQDLRKTLSRSESCLFESMTNGLQNTKTSPKSKKGLQIEKIKTKKNSIVLKYDKHCYKFIMTNTNEFKNEYFITNFLHNKETIHNVISDKCALIIMPKYNYSLEKIIDNISPKIINNIVNNITTELFNLHSKHVVYSNFELKNLVIDSDNKWKLCDFSNSSFLISDQNQIDQQILELPEYVVNRVTSIEQFWNFTKDFYDFLNLIEDSCDCVFLKDFKESWEDRNYELVKHSLQNLILLCNSEHIPEYLL